VISKKEASLSKVSVKVSGTKKTKLNQDVMKSVRAAGYDASVANAVVQIATGL